jgi:hypothetical protein
MARKTVKIEVPIGNSDEMIKLAKSVSKKHQTWQGASSAANPPVPLPVGSPLAKYDMNDFSSKTLQSEANKTEARDLEKKSQAKNKEASLIIGSGDGQSKDTKGTLYNYLTRMRDTLLDYYDDNEEMLGQWGFKVVTGQAKSPVRKTK